MTMTVQPRHTKLGLAAREGNWSYTSYELHELKEAFDRAAKTWPKWRTFTRPMAALDRAIKANDSARFTAAYEQLAVCAIPATAARIAA
jgi:hypothetical protein